MKDTEPGKARGKRIAEFFKRNPDARKTRAELEEYFGDMNKAYKNIERWAQHFLPGITVVKNVWSFTSPSVVDAIADIFDAEDSLEDRVRRIENFNQREFPKAWGQ